MVTESGNRYDIVNRYGYMGKYQFGKKTLKGLGIKVTQDEFLNSPYIQEKAMYALLKQNTDRYDDVKCFNLGVGSQNSIVHFNNGHEFNSGVVSIVPESKNPNIVLALDTFKFDKKVDFIKIDVEGHELSAFEGMQNLLLKDKPLIWLEDNIGNAVPYLKSLGYRIIKNQEETNDYLML